MTALLVLLILVLVANLGLTCWLLGKCGMLFSNQMGDRQTQSRCAEKVLQVERLAVETAALVTEITGGEGA